MSYLTLKMVPFESLGEVSYSPSVVTIAVSIVVCEIFSTIEWSDLENGTIWWITYEFLF